MARFTDSNVVDDYPPRQPSRNGRWSPDYHYAGGAAPPSPGGSVRGGSGGGGPYMTGAFPAAPATQAPPAPVLTRENSLQVPHWDRYRPRSVPPPLSPTNDNSTIAFPSSRPRSRNHARDYDRDRDRDRHEDRSSRRKPTTNRERETKGRHRERYYDSDASSSDNDDDRRSSKPSIARSRTPLSKARHALSSRFSDSTTGLGAGVIGAIVGGLAAREASENLLAKGDGHRYGDHHSSGKEALLSTIAGAAVGALGANAIEKRMEASRNKKSSSSSSAAATSPTKGSDDGRNYTWGQERRRSSTVEDKKDARDRDGGRDRETYKERDLRRDRSQRRGSKDEERDRDRERHRYHTTDDESEDEIVYDHKRRKAPNRDRDRSRPPSRREDDWR